MDCIQIREVKKFMAKLLMKTDFDHYLLSEAEIVTGNIYTIDGHVQKKFYSNEEYENLGCPVMTEWGKIRPLCFEIIKGNKTPVRFKIVLRLNDKDTEVFAGEHQIGLSKTDIGGLYLNIVYENDMLSCVTGTALNIFTMDKSLEKAWDHRIKKEFVEME